MLGQSVDDKAIVSRVREYSYARASRLAHPPESQHPTLNRKRERSTLKLDMDTDTEGMSKSASLLVVRVDA